MDSEELRAIREAVRQLQTAALQRERDSEHALSNVHVQHLDSARNLLHYAALRGVDLRDLQLRLSALGLSSLGRAEARVLQTLDAVEEVLSRLLAEDGSSHRADLQMRKQALLQGAGLLERNSSELLGAGRPGRRGRIMVTASEGIAEDPKLVECLVKEGMDLLRINCAKDDPDVWSQMVQNVRRAVDKTGISCGISCDLGGPKVRTSAIFYPEKIRLEKGDRLWLERERKPGKDAHTQEKKKADIASVGCALPEVLDDVKVGERVYFDDGKFGGKVVEIGPRGALIELDLAPPGGARLKQDKGINLPDTSLSLPALTSDDLDALDFVTAHADIVAQSFLRHADDVRTLGEELKRRNATEIGIILKLETPSAFARLPDVLLSGLNHRRVGAMVARGDLAVEVGFERLAEVQEEILWMCEAAHMPVVWATQVLESLAKKGMPTRAEVTDAAMAARAECVMLNKGYYIIDAVRFLGDVMTRMESHQQKKHSQLRRLSISSS